MKKITAVLAAISSAILLFTTTTFAWFSHKNTVTFPSSFGSAQAAYFAGGDGSAEDPYLIGSPVHLYNLAWLQYLGYFNLNSNGFNNGRAQNFFKLSSSINCKGLSIPPIGTEEFPFIGNFNGNGKTIYNVTVSNHGSDLVRRPTNAVFSSGTSNVLRLTAKSGDVSIVGLFGVTGDYLSFVDGSYSSVNKHGTLTAPTEEPITVGENEFYYSAMKIEKFYVNNLHVISQTSKTLVGLVAGYVCSTVQNAGVYACDLTLNGSARGLDGTDTVVSKYSIVGDYDENIVGWKEKPVETEGGGDQGDDASWGGSIDMRTLNRRLNYMMTKSGLTKSGTSNYVINNNKFNLNVTVTFNNEFYWNDTGKVANTAYICDGTVLPINVDASAMGLDLAEEEPHATTNFHYNSYYKNNETEIAAANNTGYIVGAGQTTNSYIRSRIQSIAGSSDTYLGICKSLGYDGSQSGVTYKAENFEMLTIVNGITYRIQDDLNKNLKDTPLASYASAKFDSGIFADSGKIYANVRQNFDKTMDGARMVHGFHFMNKFSTNSFGVDSTTIYKTSLIKGGLNFTVNSSGIIKTILGTFYNSSNKQTMFDLYKVERNDDGSIKTIARIKNVCKNSSGEIVYNKEATDGYTEVISFDALTERDSDKDILVAGAAYYFEIPVTAGDYFISADNESSANNAYLMYLDIGANGDGDGTTETPSVEKMPYNIGMVDFVSNALGSVEDDFSVPVSNSGVSYFPYYKDVSFKINGLSGTTARIWFKREDYLSTLLPTDESNQISTKIMYRFENAALLPTPSAWAQEDKTLGV